MADRTLTADRGDSGRRLDLVLRRRLTDFAGATRTRVQAWIAGGRVTVNGRVVRRAAQRVAAGDAIAVELHASAVRRTPQPEERPIDVLYQDDHLIAINKPAGLVVHPTYKHHEGTLLNALLWHTRPSDAGSRPALVGRLDRLTSGIIVAATTKRGYARLHHAVREGEKDYIAIVYGPVDIRRGVIDLPLARDARDRRRVVVSPDGSPSVTAFERLARGSDPPASVALLRCRLVTGRTHQIRVHLAACGWPIVGDPVYGEPRWTRVADPRLADVLRRFPRQALHATRVSFTHPIGGNRLTIDAPLPDDMRRLLHAAGLSAASVP